MNVLTWLFFGLIVGAFASWFMPGKHVGGIIGDVVIGVAGALAGGWIYQTFGYAGITGFDLPSMLCALVGAIVVLWFLRAVNGHRSAA